MTRRTLRARLTLLSGGLFLLAGALSLGVTYLLVRNSLDAQLTTETNSRLAALKAGADAASDSTVVLPDGEQITTSDLVEEVLANQQRVRDAALQSLLAQGGLALLVAGALALAGGWLVAGRALQPVHRITDTASRIALARPGHGLGERIALAGPDDEVKRLADTFDSMLEQLDSAFDGQRRFVANASHELRTPLTLNQALVELAITEPDATDDTKRLGRALLEVNERHERLIDGLLTLADSENPITERTAADVADIARHVVELAGPTAEAAGIDIRTSLRLAPTTGDPVLLERLVQNLVDNGVRHNQPPGWLSIETRAEDDHAVLTVTNTGAVVPAYEIEPLFQPFRRLDTSRTGRDRGFGLGLSIVRAIAQTHNGHARAEPRPGGGLLVTVELPSASP